jgi:hypothetical protein
MHDVSRQRNLAIVVMSRLSRLLSFLQSRARVAQLRLHMSAWYEEIKAKCLQAQISKIFSDRMTRIVLRRCIHTWLDMVDPLGMRVAQRFSCRRIRMSAFSSWMQFLAANKKRKRCWSGAARAEGRVLRFLRARALLAWHAVSNAKERRRRLCMFLGRRDHRCRKAECFDGWRGYQLKERDLLRRVQFESEVEEQKLRADIETCERMMSRFQWRR